jgi:hypothetical protein
MNNLPRQKLLEIVRRHGHEIITSPRRCEGLMRDNFPANRREISVLTAALGERIPAELLASGKSHLPLGALINRLAARLHDDVAMEESAARWTVHTWALALGVITPDDLSKLEHAGAQTSPRAANPVHRKEAPRSAAARSAPSIDMASETDSILPRVVPSYARTSFVVAPDGSGHFTTITEAIRQADTDSCLYVRPGIYDEGIVIDKPLEIVGDGMLEEIIVRATASSCLIMRTDEATIRNLTFRGEARAGGSSDGFFAVDIPHGRLLLDRCDISSDSLACIAIHNQTATPVIRNCRIHHGADSGVFAFDGAQGLIKACDISENANVGVAITGGANTGVINCHVHHGADAGIVVWNRGANIIEGCDIYANRRTNVGISDTGSATLRRCRIHDGGNSGIFTHRSGKAVIEECDIYRHAAPEVAVADGGDVRLHNCRIHDGQSHGVFVDDAGRALLEACDVFRNLASGVHVDANGSGVVRACRINENNLVGISCQTGSVVEIVDCDLTQNRVAARETNYGSQVVSRNNLF